jgi:hypothetical protein
MRSIRVLLSHSLLPYFLNLCGSWGFALLAAPVGGVPPAFDFWDLFWQLACLAQRFTCLGYLLALCVRTKFEIDPTRAGNGIEHRLKKWVGSMCVLRIFRFSFGSG